MTLSHNNNRLYSNPNYSNGGFTPFKFQAGIGGLGDSSPDDVLGGVAPDQVSAAQVESILSLSNPTFNPNSIQNIFSGSSGTWLIGIGILAGVFLIGGRK